MGSLFSFQQPSYQPLSYSAPQSLTPTITTTSGGSDASDESLTSTADNDNSDDSEAIKNAIQTSSARGRNSTIQTSYRGVLSEVDNSSLIPQRKSLLGE